MLLLTIERKWPKGILFIILVLGWDGINTNTGFRYLSILVVYEKVRIKNFNTKFFQTMTGDSFSMQGRSVMNEIEMAYARQVCIMYMFIAYPHR